MKKVMILATAILFAASASTMATMVTPRHHSKTSANNAKTMTSRSVAANSTAAGKASTRTKSSDIMGLNATKNAHKNSKSSKTAPKDNLSAKSKKHEKPMK